MAERWSTARGQGRGIKWLRAHVDYAGDDCLVWPYFRDPREGYGTMGHEGKVWKAHRLMCVLAHGEPPTPKHQAAHSCGNGRGGCVNPRHLRWTTPRGNAQDRSKHGTAKGPPTGCVSKLTPEAIADIQSRRLTMWEFADLYGLSSSGVWYWQSKARKTAA